MDKEQIILKLVLAEFGINDINDFNKRLILQKAIYLFQKAGMSLGYDFSWYLRGPYSTTLTKNSFDIFSVIPSLFDSYELTDETKEKVIEIRKLEQFAPEAGLPLHLWYELLASLVYLSKNCKTPSELLDKIENYKPLFERKQILLAIEKLREFRLMEQHEDQTAI